MHIRSKSDRSSPWSRNTAGPLGIRPYNSGSKPGWLTKAGIGIGPQKSLFHKLEELTQQRAGVVPAWLMSHPKTDERVAALEKLEQRWAQQ